MIPDIVIESVLFVPPTPESELCTRMKEVEEQLRHETGWGMKIVEKSGLPLAALFKPEFKLGEGCILGEECHMCRNDGIACRKRNGIYQARCLTCQNGHDDNNQTLAKEESIYIGETARPVRARIREHL